MSIKIKSKKYKIIKELGRGAFGKVYQVYDEKEKKEFALKKILFKEIPEEIDIDTFQNEANILSSIENKHIVKYFDSFKDSESFIILMEYCKDSDLKHFINKYKKEKKLIDIRIIYTIILDICIGLKEIHEKNLIHRDLKPENLFIYDKNRIKIGDFGISKQLESNDKYAFTSIGSNFYMAPEVIKGEKYNNKVDIWALGCIIYELLTLNVCFEGKALFEFVDKILNKEHGKIDLKKYDIKWQNLIDLLLNKDYQKRPDIDIVLKKVLILGKCDYNLKDIYQKYNDEYKLHHYFQNDIIYNYQEITEEECNNLKDEELPIFNSKDIFLNFNFIVLILGVCGVGKSTLVRK